MSSLRTLTLQDALACHALLGECAEMWDDAPAWQMHLASGIQQLVGGFAAAFKLSRVQGGEPVMEVAELSRTADDAMRTSIARCVHEGGHSLLPHFAQMGTLLVEDGEVALRYSNVRGGVTGYAQSEFYQRYMRPLGTGDTAIASQLKPDGHVVTLMMLRGRRERAFSERDESVLAFVSGALASDVGTRLTLLEQRGRHQLSRRLRQTLELLLEGDGEKQIAARLGLRQGTVHDYVKGVYRHFGVRSRAELLSRHAKRRLA